MKHSVRVTTFSVSRGAQCDNFGNIYNKTNFISIFEYLFLLLAKSVKVPVVKATENPV